MSIQMPIIGYALAEGAGKLAMTPEGKKNASNLAAVSEAMSWIDAQAFELISTSGAEHANRTSPFEYFDGSRIAFEPVSYAKYKLEQILDFYAGRKICLMIPSRVALFKAYDDDVMRRIWDRKIYGHSVEVLSVDCDEYPLRSFVGVADIGIVEYLIGNAMRTEEYMRNAVNGAASQRRFR